MEWLQYAERDITIRIDGRAEVVAPDGTRIWTESEGLAVWTEHPNNIPGRGQAWLSFSGNSIVAKNPDYRLIEKMLKIADDLNARVIGDDGEEYTWENLNEIPRGDTPKRQPWWKFWK